MEPQESPVLSNLGFRETSNFASGRFTSVTKSELPVIGKMIRIIDSSLRFALVLSRNGMDSLATVSQLNDMDLPSREALMLLPPLIYHPGETFRGSTMESNLEMLKNVFSYRIHMIDTVFVHFSSCLDERFFVSAIQKVLACFPCVRRLVFVNGCLNPYIFVLNPPNASKSQPETFIFTIVRQIFKMIHRDANVHAWIHLAVDENYLEKAYIDVYQAEETELSKYLKDRRFLWRNLDESQRHAQAPERTFETELVTSGSSFLPGKDRINLRKLTVSEDVNFSVKSPFWNVTVLDWRPSIRALESLNTFHEVFPSLRCLSIILFNDQKHQEKILETLRISFFMQLEELVLHNTADLIDIDFCDRPVYLRSLELVGFRGNIFNTRHTYVNSLAVSNGGLKGIVDSFEIRPLMIEHNREQLLDMDDERMSIQDHFKPVNIRQVAQLLIETNLCETPPKRRVRLPLKSSHSDSPACRTTSVIVAEPRSFSHGKCLSITCCLD